MERGSPTASLHIYIYTVYDGRQLLGNGGRREVEEGRGSGWGHSRFVMGDDGSCSLFFVLVVGCTNKGHPRILQADDPK